MAEFFKGLLKSKDEKALDRMIADYAKGGTPEHRDTAELLKTSLAYSPDLRARTLEVIHDGHLRGYTDHGVQAGGSASYHVHDGSIRMRPERDTTGGRYVPVDRIFLLGHETEHARSLRGVNYVENGFGREVQRIAGTPGAGPRDYTDAIEQYVQRTRAEEGRAHLGGFNAVASFMRENHPSEPGKLLRDLYEASPGRMGDFIDKSVYGEPPTYLLKPGLTMDRDGSLPYSAGNIDAMKLFYADKAQLGPERWNYRQDVIETAVGVIKGVEKDLAERSMEDRPYVIDPVRLHADPAHALPADGRLTAKGAIEMQSLESLLGASTLASITASSSSPTTPVASSSSPPVSLAAGPDDHPLFAQALTGLGPLHAKDNLGSAQEVRNLAAALAVSAQERGLRHIEFVAHSDDGRGVIATQGTGDVALSARVDGMGGIGTPEATSLAKLTPVETQSVATTSPTPVVQASSSEPGHKPQHV